MDTLEEKLALAGVEKVCIWHKGSWQLDFNGKLSKKTRLFMVNYKTATKTVYNI